jgi:hypothetical protein
VKDNSGAWEKDRLDVANLPNAILGNSDSYLLFAQRGNKVVFIMHCTVYLNTGNIKDPYK